jgi:membrane protease YdiL (CAAX protease family)
LAAWRAFSTATVWCILVLVTLQSGLLLLRGAWPAASTSVWSLGAVQVSVLGGLSLAFASMHRVELGITSSRGAWPRAFALESSGWGLISLAVLAAAGLQIPAEVLRDAMERISPTPEAERLLQLEFLRHDSTFRVLSLFAVVGLVGPFVEELFYRGSLFRFLERTVGGNASFWFTSVVFVCTHAAFRDWPSLLVVALMMGYFRLRSGSLWPSFALHAGFNSATLWRVVVDADELRIPGLPGALALVASILLCAAAVAGIRRAVHRGDVWRA